MKSKYHIDNPDEDLRDGWWIEKVPGVSGNTMFIRYEGVVKKSADFAREWNIAKDTIWYRARNGKSPAEMRRPSDRNHPDSRDKSKLYAKSDTPSFFGIRPFGEEYGPLCSLGWGFGEH